MARSVAVALGAVVLVAGVAGCAAPADLLGTHTAQVTIEGVGIDRYPVRCSQFGWRWIIETLQRSPGFTAIVSTDETVAAGVVHLRDLGGFSGTFGRDIVGEAQASLENGTFLVSSTAVGVAVEKPTEQTRRSFTIQTDC